MKEGSDRVEVKFDQEYAAPPIVNANLSLQHIEDGEVRRETEELLLASDVKYIITKVTKEGFEIRVERKADSDIPFAWSAWAVKDAKVFASEKVKGEDKKTVDAEYDEEKNNIDNDIEKDEPVATAESAQEALVGAPMEPVSENSSSIPIEQSALPEQNLPEAPSVIIAADGEIVTGE